MTATTPASETAAKEKTPRPRNLSRILQDAMETAAMDLASLYFRGQHLKGFPRDEDFHERIKYKKSYQVLTVGEKYAQVEIEFHSYPDSIEDLINGMMTNNGHVLPLWAREAIQEYLRREPIDVTRLPDMPLEYRNPEFSLKYLGAPIVVTAPDLRHPSYQAQLAAWQLVCQMLGPAHVEVRLGHLSEGKVDKPKKETSAVFPQSTAPRKRARLKTADKKLNELISSLF